MNRRDLISKGLGAAVATTALVGSANEKTDKSSMGNKFKLKYAPHFKMFRHSAGDDPIDQLKFAAERGFTAWEDNGMMRKSPELQSKIGETMQSLGMTMGVFVSYSGMKKTDFVTKTDKAFQDSLRAKMKEALETAKRVNAKWTTVVPGNVNQKLEMGYQTANCIENLKVMAEVCEKQGLVMVLEPLNWYANHPGLFLTSIPQSYQICKAVGSPSCKILNDLYHQQITEGNLIPNIDKSWSEISYFQVGDNPGRKEPTTGEINYKNIFKHLHSKGYKGIIGMEHGNSKAGKEGEEAIVKAYQECDSF